jgi:arabinose-5-phosphate isomerase
MPLARDWSALAKETFDIELEGLEHVKVRLGESFSRAVEILAACKGRVIITGLGKSGLVGRKIAATLSSTGTASFFLHPVEGQHGDLGSIRDDDAVIAISYSGKTDELNAILPVLRSFGVKIVAITGGMDSPLASLADVTLNVGVPREACPMNLAPTTSTTATLAMGDALAVCLIEAKSFTKKDFKRVHPGGALGQRLRESVGELMHKAAPTTPLMSDFGRAVADVHNGGLGATLIVDEAGKALGIITDGDIRRSLLNGGIDASRAVAEVMTPKFRHARPEMSVADVLNIMEDHAITVLPVLDGNGVVQGIIHMHDLLGKGDIKFGE